MFNPLSVIGALTMKQKLIIYAIVAFIVMGFLFAFKYYYDKSIKNGIQITKLEKEIKEKNDEIISLNKIKENDDQLIKELHQDILKITETGIKDKEKVDKVVTKIIEKYKLIDPDNKQSDQKNKEISEARITSLWETYCRSHTQHEQCVKLVKEKKNEK